MSLWQCKIITPTGERTEIIDGKEKLTDYVGKDLLERGEVAIIIQRKVSNGIKKSKTIKKPWWKFW